MISQEDTKHMAKLARLGLKETEIKKSQKDLSSILDYFNSLKTVDVSNIEPTFHPIEYYSKEGLIKRKDTLKLKQCLNEQFDYSPSS